MAVSDLYLSTLNRIEGKVDDLSSEFTSFRVEIAEGYVTKREYEADRESDRRKRRTLIGALATVAAGALGLAGNAIGVI